MIMIYILIALVGIIVGMLIIIIFNAINENANYKTCLIIRVAVVVDIPHVRRTIGNSLL